MKYLLILLILLVGISVTSCGQEKYDFSKIKSQSEIDALLLKIKQENEGVKIDTSYRLNEITIKGMHYAGVPIKTALISDYYTLLTTDTINYSAKNILETLESEKGLTAITNKYNNNVGFKWKTETEDNDLNIKFVNGKHLASFGNKDYAELTINYKPVYDMPLANIHKKIKTFDKQPKYVLQAANNHGHSDYVYVINGVKLSEDFTSQKFYLNNYIISEVTSIKIIVKPGLDGDNFRPKLFKEGNIFSATIYDEETEEIIANIENVPIGGKATAEFSLEFDSKLPYYPKAWTQGVDLRNDKNLEEKVISFYDKLGKTILAKDKQTINDMFYQKNFETQQLKYDTNYVTARSEWEAHLAVQNNSYKYKVAKNFDIEFSADGKLIFAHPKAKTEMLILTGKQYYQALYYFLYQPKGSNELKIIR